MKVKDLLGMGHGNDVERSTSKNYEVEEVDTLHEGEDVQSIKRNGRIRVQKLSLIFFRKKLIRHFNIACHKHEVHWTTQSKFLPSFV